jgi:ABC-type antimicrobial peptide transport system permease subunit
VVITGAGILAGVLLAIPLGQLMGAILFGVDPHDPLLLGLAALLLGSIAVAASWWPASRALKVDPLVALRTE